MAVTPNITLTATLKDSTGATSGNTANPSKLVIALCRYGLSLPRVPDPVTAGQGIMLARPGPFSIISAGAPISTPLFANDQIEPAGTYYTIAVLDQDNNTVQCGAYLLTGSGTVDLADLVPIDPDSVVLGNAYIVLRDTADGTLYTMFIANGQLTPVAGGSSPLDMVALKDQVTAANFTITITSGQIVVSAGGVGAMPDLPFVDTLTGIPYLVTMQSGQMSVDEAIV